MTHLDVVFRYSQPPREPELRAINNLKEVYGIRRILLDDKERTVRVEYDASRLNSDAVAALLRNSGMDIGEKVQLA
jgi:hypothetical protein